MAIMGIRRDTKAFATAPVDSVSKSASQSDRGITPQELQALGVSDIGEFANKVADANYIDPKAKLRGTGNDKLDKDAFMKIMLVQMKNQDPTNPLKSHEMAAQLAQFTQLEQLQNINTNLDEMKAQAKPSESFQSLNLLGKVVAGDSSRIFRAKGDRDHDISFQLPNSAKTVKISITNEAGDVVRNATINNAKAGGNTWTWNGRDNKDNVMPSGNYKVTIEAFSSNDQKLTVKTDFEGIISGVNFTPQGTLLMVGNQAVRLQDIRKIVDPSLKNKDQNLSAQSDLDLKENQNTVLNEEKGAPEAENQGKPRVLEQVALSREMMDRIEKDLTPKSTNNKGDKK
jgi:flagellar basal-body rod modification protein FlgD